MGGRERGEGEAGRVGGRGREGEGGEDTHINGITVFSQQSLDLLLHLWGVNKLQEVGGREEGGGRRQEGGARPLRIATRHNTLQLAFTTPLSFPPLHSASESWTNLLGGHFLESTLSHILQWGSDCGHAHTTWLQEKLITHTHGYQRN